MRRSRIRRLPIHSYRRMFLIADRMVREEIAFRKEGGADLEGVYGVVSWRIHADPFTLRRFKDDASLYDCLNASFACRI